MSVFKSQSDLLSSVTENLSDGIMLILLLFEGTAASPGGADGYASPQIVFLGSAWRRAGCSLL